MPVNRSQLELWDREHLWHPFTQMRQYAGDPSLIIERSEGCLLIDVEGHRYIDGVSSLWCNVHGHRAAELDAAVRNQLDRVAHTTLLGPSHPPAIELARRLVELTPDGLNRVFFSDNGSTAVEVALKMAFQYWQQCDIPRPGKTRFLSPAGAYHGDTLGGVSVGGIDLFHAVYKPLLFPTWHAPAPYCYRCPLGLQSDTCSMQCADAMVDLVREHHEELAAVVIEPLVQGAAGIIVTPDGYLQRVREVTREYDVLLIADEVAVGFGRTGTMFACEQEDVSPDFLCLAKGLTGGYLPLAATLATDEVYSAFLGEIDEARTFYHGHTFTGNPLAAAVSLANLALFEKPHGNSPSLLAALPAKIDLLRASLQRIASLDHVGDVRQKGLMVGIELVANRDTRQPYPLERQLGRAVCLQARSRGALLRPLGDVVVIMPPLSISLDMLEELCEIVCESIEAACTATTRVV